jgi:hypothetical protein
MEHIGAAHEGSWPAKGVVRVRTDDITAWAGRVTLMTAKELQLLKAAYRKFPLKASPTGGEYKIGGGPELCPVDRLATESSDPSGNVENKQIVPTPVGFPGFSWVLAATKPP